MVRTIVLLGILIGSAGILSAEEICVVESGIDHEDGKWAYETGIGPEGAVPRPIRLRNEKARSVFEKAAKDLDSRIELCMVGDFAKDAFEVDSASLKPIDAPAAENTIPATKESVQEQTRCGWFHNPTPGNWSLEDKDADWTIAEQGGYRAEGLDDIPDFGNKWVVTNAGGHGYGCACAQVKVDAKEKTILSIRKVKVLPISRCRRDKRLHKQ